MIIGLISDTHNNVELTNKAVEVFKERGVEFVIHSGDLTSPRILDMFSDFKCRAVLGNGDLDCKEINEKAEALGFSCLENYCSFEVDGKKFIVFHGNNVAMYREAVASGEYDYIIKGHTHMFEDYKANKSRIINPGALYAADEYTIAVLNTADDRLEMIKIEAEE